MAEAKKEKKQVPTTRQPEFAEKVAEVLGITKKQAEVNAKAVLDVIEHELAQGKRITFLGFGTFEVRERKARKARNPQTGESIDVPASKVPAFKAGNRLKDVVAGKTIAKPIKSVAKTEKAEKAEAPAKSGKKNKKKKHK